MHTLGITQEIVGQTGECETEDTIIHCVMSFIALVSAIQNETAEFDLEGS